MSYQSQAQLEADYLFQQRSRAAAVQQAAQFNDPLAGMVRRDDAGVVAAFVRLNAAGPGIADKADTGEGSVDSSKVTDADLLSLTQANWPIVADLYPTGAAPL